MKFIKRNNNHYLLVKLNAGKLCFLDYADELADYTDNKKTGRNGDKENGRTMIGDQNTLLGLHRFKKAQVHRARS